MTRTLLCYGDSNTHGTMPMHTLDELGRFDRSTRWTGQLARLLPDWHVIEEGQPGRTTVHDDPIEGAHRNGLTVLPAILESHRAIDAVILMLGTNDLKGRFSLNATDIALSLEKLVLVIKASLAGPNLTPPAVLLVAPPPIREIGPIGEIFWGGEAKSRTLGARIAVSAWRVGVPFLDAGHLIKVSHIDGIHYDEAEQGILARAFAGAVEDHFC
jgi:lysophospholipase L1-like esterase